MQEGYDMRGSMQRFALLASLVTVMGIFAGGVPAQAGLAVPQAGLIRAAVQARVPAGLRPVVAALAARKQGVHYPPGAREFGYSVAVSGSTAVIGAPATNSDRGVAYVFTEKGQTWTRQAELTPSVAVTAFGLSVAVSGSTAVVGAYGPGAFKGAAFVFARSLTRAGKVKWPQQAELTTSAAGDTFFGVSVAVSRSTVVVGAYLTAGTGAAFVFARSVTRAGKVKWSQQAELTTSAAFAAFGWSVAVSGSTAVVGAPNGASGPGAAYVFTRTGTSWSQQAELTAPGGAVSDDFGYSVAVSGSTVVVGAPGADAGYVFARSGTTWSQQAELTTLSSPAGAQFGRSVAVSGPTAVVGAVVLPTPDNGAAYMFARSGASWSQEAELTSPGGGVVGDGFGTSVAVSGPTAVIGAPYAGASTGAAYVVTYSAGSL